MEVELSHAATKDLTRLPRNTRDTILGKIDEVAADPAQARNVRPLKGSNGLLRKRVGDLRVTYEIDQERNVLRVLEVKPRGSAYR